jgi:two-component system LytT family sensor kinase
MPWRTPKQTRKKMKKIIKNYIWHIVFWACFIAYEVTSVKVITGVFGSAKNYIMHYPINISLVYIISEYILPKTFSKKERKYTLLLFLIALTMILFLIASNVTDRILGTISDEIFFGSSGITEIFIGGTIYRYIYFMGFGITLFLSKNRMLMLKRTNELEKEASEKELGKRQLALELAEAKNAYLRTQINPHFMLSTLSYIHDNTRLSEPEAAQAVLYLSKLLRYALATEHGPEKVPLHIEIEQVENLFNITKIRKAQTFIEFNYEQKDTEVKVIPFVLLSLAENMLKHGNLSDASNPGKITISIMDNILTIHTSNVISAGINDTGFHTGLSSIRERLAHIYGNRGTISYGNEKSNHFTATVSFPLDI